MLGLKIGTLSTPAVMKAFIISVEIIVYTEVEMPASI